MAEQFKFLEIRKAGLFFLILSLPAGALRSQSCTGPPAMPGSLVGPLNVCSGSTHSYSVAPVVGATSYSWTLPSGWSGTSTTNSISFTIPANFTPAIGILQAYATNTCGISLPSSGGPTVFPAPSITISAAAYTVCPGQVTSLSANSGGATTFSWTGGIINEVGFFPSQTSTFMVTGTSSQGCTATAVTTIVVVPYPNSFPSVIPSAICEGGSSVITATGAATNYTWLPGNSNFSVLVVTPSVTSTFTLIKANGPCSFSQTIVVTVFPNPTVTVGAGNFSVCAGNTVVLSGAGAFGYSWTGGVNNGVPFSPTVTNTYTVIGTSANSCTGSASATVSVSASPSLSISASNSSVCMGASVMLNATGASTYFWSGGVVNNLPFTPAGSAIYTVTGTDNNGCAASSTVAVTALAIPVITITGANAICVGESTWLMAAGAQSYTWNTTVVSSSTQVSPTTTSTYVVAATGTNNCTANATKTLSVNPLPVLSIAGNTAVCYGKSGVLIVSGAGSYTWSNGLISSSITISPSVTALYKVVAKDLNGCVDSLSTQMVVLVVPSVKVTSSSQEICAGERIVLTGTGAEQFLWNSGSSSPTISLFPKISTTYTVTGTYTNGCSNTVTYTQKVQPCTGLEKLPVNDSRNYLFPNPSSGIFSLNLPDFQIISDVSAYNLSGMLIWKSNQILPLTDVDITTQPPGIYLVRILFNSGVIVQYKLLKE